MAVPQDINNEAATRCIARTCMTGQCRGRTYELEMRLREKSPDNSNLHSRILESVTRNEVTSTHELETPSLLSISLINITQAIGHVLSNITHFFFYIITYA